MSPKQHLWHLQQTTVMKNFNEKFTHIRYKGHPGDLFRSTLVFKQVRM